MAEVSKTYGAGPTRVQLQNKDPRGYAEFLAQLGEHSTRGSANTQRGVQARQSPRSHQQHEFVHIRDEIINRAIGAADVPRQFAGFQAGEAGGTDASLRRQDQFIPEF